MELSFKLTPLVVAIVFTGLSAGLCFTWSNTITPGIGRLNDLDYLSAFQQMNRAILNPTFFVVFFGPFILGLLNLYLFRNTSGSFLWMYISAIAIYFLGVVLVTILGNVPLNEMLDKTDLSLASNEEINSLRDAFEVQWNRLHLIRTISTITSFILLILSLIQIIKND